MTPNILGRAIVLAFLAAGASWATPTDADRLKTLQDSLAKAGPEATLKQYFECTPANPNFLLIGRGDPKAVKLAVTLLPHTDGCVGETMMANLEEAMANNPEAVLPYLGHGVHLDAEALCTPQMLFEPKPEEYIAALERTKRAVLPVARPDLQTAKRACLKAIDEQESKALTKHP